MPDFSPILNAINNGTLTQPSAKRRWVEVGDRISVHAKGIRPRFKNPRKAAGRAWITPANYDPRYAYLFDDYILNRHPNEQEDHYYWRLATFPIISQEIYLNAKRQILGAIFQTSEFKIRANEESDQAYLESIGFINQLSGDIAEHVFTDPFGMVAVIEGHSAPFPATEEALPVIDLVESRNIEAYQPGEYLIYKPSAKINDREALIYLDANWCIKFTKREDNGKFETLTYYEHGLGRLAAVQCREVFFQPFVAWADMLARNISDDEVIAKNASYPHKQVVEPICQRCMGNKKVPTVCPDGKAGCFAECPDCDGRGTTSINIGEVYVVKERAANDPRPMDDYVKFINPDISINDFSFKRWQAIYDMGLRSMHLKFVEEAQSGVAKAYDREQLYFLLVGVKNVLFDIAAKCIEAIIAYRNVEAINGQITHARRPFTIVAPRQFKIKTEYELQAEYMALTEKNADIMLRRVKLEEYIQRAFYGDNFALKKFEIVKAWDFLYAMNDNELSSRRLLGSAMQADFVRHDRADYLINQLANEKGEAWIVKTPLSVIITALEALLAPLLPPAAIPVPSDIITR